jgi:L-histidine N-alpha-methyltransferase
VSSLLTVDVHLTDAERAVALADDVRAGLTASPKTLPPVWFYDERGSVLFDQITRLPEYYLTRAEHAILAAHADEIAAIAGADVLVEIGSGTSEKTRLLLDAMASADSLRRVVPFDVSEEMLRGAAASIAEEYGVDVHAVVGDFHRHVPELPREGRRLVAFLGSTIGNLTPAQRTQFFVDLAASMSRDEALLIGTDLAKDPRRLEAAYDDAQGVTAAFNRNVLRVLNRELDATFDPEAFAHVARWNAADGWMEMRLRSLGDQDVTIRALDLEVHFAAGEELLTEISAKFTVEQVHEELSASGFVVARTWTDPAGDFLLSLARPSRVGAPA